MKADRLDELQKEIDNARFVIVNCIGDADLGKISEAIATFERVDLEVPMNAIEELDRDLETAQKFNAERAKRVMFAKKVVERPDKTIRKMVKAKDFTPSELVKLVTLMQDVDRINKMIIKHSLLHKSEHGLMKFTILRYATKLGQHHLYLAEMNDWIHFTAVGTQEDSLKELLAALDHVTQKKMEARAKGKAEMTLDDFLAFVKDLHKKSKEELEGVKGIVVASEFGSARIDDIDHKGFHIEGFPKDVWAESRNANMVMRFASKISEKKLRAVEALLEEVKPHGMKSIADLIHTAHKWKDEQFRDLAQFDARFAAEVGTLKYITRLFKKR